MQQQIRQIMRQRIGAIIHGLLGDERLEQLFDDAPQPTTATPSGMLAVQMGLISREFKNALLTAQAAERIACLADDASAGDFSATRQIAGNDPVFQHIGHPNDPAELVNAQQDWKKLQMEFNQLGDASSQAEAQDFCQRARELAAKHYRIAANGCAAIGEHGIATNFKAGAQSIARLGAFQNSVPSAANAAQQPKIAL